MTTTALYTNADQTTDLVILDESDSVLEVVREALTDAEVDAIHTGAEYSVDAHDVEVGDGDTFRRLVAR